MQRRALVFGGVAWNHLLYVDRFPDPVPQTVFAERSFECVGGTGAGKAMNLAALGWDVELWAALGDDAAGRHVVAEVEASGVDLVPLADPAGTARHVNLMDAHGARLSVFANAGGDEAAFDATRLLAAARAADMVTVAILEHCRAVLPLLGDAGVPLWIDVHDYDGVNAHHDDFVAAATHLQLSSERLPAWREFAESRIAAGCETVVVTHGVDGADAVGADGRWFHVDASPVDEVIDTNGAGDAFLAGFVSSWLERTDLERALDAGADAAAAAVRSPRIAPIGR